MQRRRFSRKFKVEAVKLVRERGASPISGAFLLASVLHFYSGHPLLNHSGVDPHLSKDAK